jgi:hypothetical protein
MIGQTLRHTKSRIKGAVDMVTVHPDGRALARIKDHWLFVDDLEAI